jgi:DNA repair photolyase
MDTGARELVVREIECKSALVKSRIPGADWCLNPYGGCAHGCIYCYASFMERFRPHDSPWGTFVDVKGDLPVVLARQLRRPKQGTVMLASVTDAYQPVEAKARLTRDCLQLLLASDLHVSILTKSDLVLRDLDLLVRFRTLLGEWRVSVGFSLPVLRDDVAAVVEPGASPPSRRLAALGALSQRGIPTWVFVSPVLPAIADLPEELEAVVAAAKAHGAGYVMYDPLNFYPAAVAGLSRAIAWHFPSARMQWLAALGDKAGWEQRVRQVLDRVAESC